MIKFLLFLYLAGINLLFSSLSKKDLLFHFHTTALNKQIYYDHRTNQTVAFVQNLHEKYFPLHRKQLSVQEVVDLMDHYKEIINPYHKNSLTLHPFQTAEKLRTANQARSLILTGLIHDMGTLLFLFDQPHWSLVGETFPVGCFLEDKNLISEFYELNPDRKNPLYNTQYGIYESNWGFNALLMLFSHNEYLYQLLRPCLPKEAFYILPCHSFGAADKRGGYTDFMNEEDYDLVKYLETFSYCDQDSEFNFDLDLDKLPPFYQKLVSEFLPEKIQW